MKRNEQGDVVLYRIDVTEHDRSALIDPPPLFLPSELRPRDIFG